MPPIAIAPIAIKGPWDEGYALDRHTVSSTFLGYDGMGNAQFDTKRSPLGELVFRLKNRNDRTVVDAIAETVGAFLIDRKYLYEIIVPVPASRERAFQPTVEIARAVSARVGRAMVEAAVRKVRATPELKNVYGSVERSKLLGGVFEADPAVVGGRSVLLIDDLYRSGATMKAIARVLQVAGAARIVALALTKTRVRL